MEVFAYTPGGSETIDQLNQRLAKYAQGNNVTGVVPTTLGSTLLLSVTLDQDIPAPILLCPFVAVIEEAAMPVLEMALSNLLKQIKSADTEDNMSMPVEVRAISAPHAPTKQVGYAIIMVAIGELDEALSDEVGGA